MIRGGIKSKITAAIYIKIYNRIIDFPFNLFSALNIIINDFSKWKQFKDAPFKSFKNKFLGDMP